MPVRSSLTPFRALYMVPVVPFPCPPLHDHSSITQGPALDQCRGRALSAYHPASFACSLLA